MYNISTYGYSYQGPVKSSKSLHTSRVRIAKVLVLLAFFTLSFLFGAFIQAYASDEEPIHASVEAAPIEPAYVAYSVEPGDTLWSIAKVHLPKDTDIREFIHDIKAMNHLNTSVLQVGQTLQIPISY